MGPSPSYSDETGRLRTITSAHLLDRARQYWFAAAVTDDWRDVEMFCDLAMMFERLARDFRRFEQQTYRAAVHSELNNHRPLTCPDKLGVWPTARSVDRREAIGPELQVMEI